MIREKTFRVISQVLAKEEHQAHVPMASRGTRGESKARDEDRAALKTALKSVGKLDRWAEAFRVAGFTTLTAVLSEYDVGVFGCEKGAEWRAAVTKLAEEMRLGGNVEAVVAADAGGDALVNQQALFRGELASIVEQCRTSWEATRKAMLEAVGHTKTGSGACEVSELWEVVAMQRGNQPLALADRGRDEVTRKMRLGLANVDRQLPEMEGLLVKEFGSKSGPAADADDDSSDSKKRSRAVALDASELTLIARRLVHTMVAAAGVEPPKAADGGPERLGRAGQITMPGAGGPVVAQFDWTLSEAVDVLNELTAEAIRAGGQAGVGVLESWYRRVARGVSVSDTLGNQLMAVAVRAALVEAARDGEARGTKRARTPEGAEACKLWASDGRCRRGGSCPYSHEEGDKATKPSAGKAQRKQEQQAQQQQKLQQQLVALGFTQMKATPPPGPGPTGGQTTCRDFQRGQCTRGVACRFAHVAANPAAGGPRPPPGPPPPGQPMMQPPPAQP